MGSEARGEEDNYSRRAYLELLQYIGGLAYLAVGLLHMRQLHSQARPLNLNIDLAEIQWSSARYEPLKQPAEASNEGSAH